jgi:hypothetical protein
MGRPRDSRNDAQGVARELANIVARLASLKAEVVKAEATAWLSDPSYDVLRFRLEEAHSAAEAATIEARRRVRLNETRGQ